MMFRAFCFILFCLLSCLMAGCWRCWAFASKAGCGLLVGCDVLLGDGSRGEGMAACMWYMTLFSFFRKIKVLQLYKLITTMMLMISKKYLLFIGLLLDLFFCYYSVELLCNALASAPAYLGMHARKRCACEQRAFRSTPQRRSCCLRKTLPLRFPGPERNPEGIPGIPAENTT